MKLTHYSDRPLGELRSSCQMEPFGRYSKPSGLWVSVDGEDDWPTWCRENGFRLNFLTHEHEVILTDDARILVLTCASDIDAFTQEYSAPDGYGTSGIRWCDVAKKWHGIIIAPYVWERRLERNCSWYYGWDCASGCIWDVSAIASVKLRSVMQIFEDASC